MKIGIVGGGVTGRATARAWLEHCEEVRVYDLLPERRTHDVFETRRCDLVFVCLPEDAVDAFFAVSSSLGKESIGRNANYVLRSTVPIGTTRRLREKFDLPNLVHNPEFLTARCAVADACNPAVLIIGMPDRYLRDQETVEPGLVCNFPTQICYRALRRAYEDRFPGIPIQAMSSNESEAVKLFLNGFFAVKVAFFNELRTLADKLGLDWETVRAGMMADGRICPSHTRVPGPDGRRGFGGACLPKDLETLIQCMASVGIPVGSTLCLRAEERNKGDRNRAQPNDS
jgi:UDP-glucose 6-dehydrogenase